MVILCVDDDPEDIEIFIEAVKEHDASVQCRIARNGKQAMDILQSDISPDLIFLDINMPVINGRVILSEIRRDKKFKDIPVVMYSTAISQAEIDDLKNMGADHFMVKHNHFQDLCDAIAAIFGTIRR